jgi:hypothetical protein
MAEKPSVTILDFSGAAGLKKGNIGEHSSKISIRIPGAKVG